MGARQLIYQVIFAVLVSFNLRLGLKLRNDYCNSTHDLVNTCFGVMGICEVLKIVLTNWVNLIIFSNSTNKLCFKFFTHL